MAKLVAEDVVNAFINLVKEYERFRVDNGLQESNASGFEMCTALMDKGGRIARQVKHFERNDPKEDWPDGLIEAMTGQIVYMLMMLRKYRIDIQSQYKGMVNELNSSIKQYAATERKG